MGQTAVTIRMDSDLKQKFDILCNDFGMSVNTAFNVFVRTVVRTKSIPFKIESSPITKEDLLAKGRDAFEQLRLQAENNGLSSMTLDDINAEIHESRNWRYDRTVCSNRHERHCSALITKRTDSPTRLVLDYLFTGRIIPVYNDEIINEYQNVLSRPKFKLSKDLITTVVEIIKEVGLPMERKPCNEDMPDPKDIVFYEVALAKESSYLVTGNIKHFPSHPLVVTPSEMIRIIDSNEMNGY